MSEAGRVTVHLRGLEVFGRHGVHEFERSLGQPFVVDLSMTLSRDDATRSDDLADTVDYAAVADAVAELVAGPPDRLIERLAGRIADRALAEPGVVGVEVTVAKPHVTLPHDVRETAVTLLRGVPS